MLPNLILAVICAVIDHLSWVYFVPTNFCVLSFACYAKNEYYVAVACAIRLILLYFIDAGIFDMGFMIIDFIFFVVVRNCVHNKMFDNNFLYKFSAIALSKLMILFILLFPIGVMKVVLLNPLLLPIVQWLGSFSTFMTILIEAINNMVLVDSFKILVTPFTNSISSYIFEDNIIFYYLIIAIIVPIIDLDISIFFQYICGKIHYRTLKIYPNQFFQITLYILILLCYLCFLLNYSGLFMIFFMLLIIILSVFFLLGFMIFQIMLLSLGNFLLMLLHLWINEPMLLYLCTLVILIYMKTIFIPHGIVILFIIYSIIGMTFSILYPKEDHRLYLK